MIKYIFKGGIFLLLIMQSIIKNKVSYIDIMVILIMLISNILREKYLDSFIIILLEIFFIYYGTNSNIYFIELYGIIVFDLINNQKYRNIALYLVPVVIILGGYLTPKYEIFEYGILIFICVLLGYLYRELIDNKETFKKLYDGERRNRYELEITKQRLLESSRDIAHMAEIKERNRIAREIHDTIGHSIAGILMQLQAAYKIREKDIEKSYNLIERSIEGLSDSLVVLRNTVHSIKPNEKLGVEYIRAIIDNFNFCYIDFKHTGDFNIIPANIIEIIATNIKEALTNTYKHSNADKIEIVIDINDKYLRLYIKDNGRGCEKIKEGLGLNGMNDRIGNIGGSISISGSNGFLIVCIIPINN